MDAGVVTLICSICTVVGAVAGAIAVYWKSRSNGHGPDRKTPVPKLCEVHAGFAERLRLGETVFAELKAAVSEQTRVIAEIRATVARVEGMLAARA